MTARRKDDCFHKKTPTHIFTRVCLCKETQSFTSQQQQTKYSENIVFNHIYVTLLVQNVNLLQNNLAKHVVNFAINSIYILCFCQVGICRCKVAMRKRQVIDSIKKPVHSVKSLENEHLSSLQHECHIVMLIQALIYQNMSPPTFSFKLSFKSLDDSSNIYSTLNPNNQ